MRRIQDVATTNASTLGEQVTDREYVWGPGYVDELIAQIDANNFVMYVTQDANQNVVGLYDVSGNILAQYTHTPYGELLATEDFASHPPNAVGHQGLFFDRFDGSPTDPPLTPGAAGLYYNRNRHYAPVLGRFLQAEPDMFQSK